MRRSAARLLWALGAMIVIHIVTAAVECPEPRLRSIGLPMTFGMIGINVALAAVLAWLGIRVRRGASVLPACMFVVIYGAMGTIAIAGIAANGSYDATPVLRAVQLLLGTAWLLAFIQLARLWSL
jgi:hypothetical protein